MRYYLLFFLFGLAFIGINPISSLGSKCFAFAPKLDIHADEEAIRRDGELRMKMEAEDRKHIEEERQRKEEEAKREEEKKKREEELRKREEEEREARREELERQRRLFG
ncbi:hypothetical protein [Simkania negevensis]|uniref:Uncharacterized protein n=1 Tax=Simkania negevensis (strain ATCC VR-1471 / DSM 27360 / Z) TaxID=331113 RepID=F8L6P7_SIMNZ|nr:hypothetical protein [Simkania negevensis]CCB88395.1 unknown protein [Simkania negevensis Z]